MLSRSKLSLLLSAWLVLASGVGGAAAETVRIAAILGLTGPLADASQDLRDAAILAAEKLKGRSDVDLQLVFEDSRWDPKIAISALNMVSDAQGARIVYVIGSAITMALKPITEQRGILLFSTATHPLITRDSKLILRHSNFLEDGASSLARVAAGQRPLRVAIISVQDEYALAYARHFENRLHNENPAGSFKRFEYLPDEVDFRSLVTQVVKWSPQAVAISALGLQAGTLLVQLHEQRYSGAVYVSNSLSLTSGAIELVRAKDICGFYYEDYPEQNAEFVEEFRARFKRHPSGGAILGYTDMELLHHGIVAVGSDPKRLVPFIRALGKFRGTYQTVPIHPSGDIRLSTEIKRWECTTGDEHEQ